MRIWVLEHKRSKRQRVCDAIQTFTALTGIKCSIHSFSRPKDVKKTVDLKKLPQVFFYNPESYDDIYSGQSLVKELSTNNVDMSFIVIADSEKYAFEGYAMNVEGYVLYSGNITVQISRALKRIQYRYKLELANISLRVNRTLIHVPISDITFVESDAHYIIVHTKHSCYRSYATLTEMYNNLPVKYSFVQVGKSYVVNLNYIENYSKHHIVLKNQLCIPIPIRVSRGIMSQLENSFSLYENLFA